MTTASTAREKVARYLHALMGPRGENHAAAWAEATEPAREAYRREADQIIGWVHADASPPSCPVCRDQPKPGHYCADCGRQG
jgi:hypothetical protein